MKACMLILCFVGTLKISLCFSIMAGRRNIENDAQEATEFPFKEAKVKYHRSRYCITAFGETNCVRMSEVPGDPKKIARLYRIWSQSQAGDPKDFLRALVRRGTNSTNPEITSDFSKLSRAKSRWEGKKMHQKIGLIKVEKKRPRHFSV